MVTLGQASQRQTQALIEAVQRAMEAGTFRTAQLASDIGAAIFWVIQAILISRSGQTIDELVVDLEVERHQAGK